MPQYRNPRHFGLVVGIDRYPDLSHLEHACHDAKAFYDWLTDPVGGSVPPGNCCLVVAEDGVMQDNTPREQAVPDQDQVHKAINKLWKWGEAVYKEDANRWPETRLYYYVAGHGVAIDPRDAALLMANAGRPDWMGLHISCKAVLDLFLRRQTFRELVIFADCCRDPEPRAPWMPLPFDQNLITNRGGVVVAICYATLFGEQSFEPAEANQRRGYFTDALLRGLRGEAAQSGEAIDTNNLSAFVKQRVRYETQAVGYEQQEPEFQCDPGKPVVFRSKQEIAAVAAAPVDYAVVLDFEAFAGTVQLSKGDLTPIGVPRVIVAGLPLALRLPTGLFLVEPVPADAAVFKNRGFFKVVGGDCNVKL